MNSLTRSGFCARRQLRHCNNRPCDWNPQSLELQIKLKKSSTKVLMNEIEAIVKADPHSEKVLQMYKEEEAQLAQLMQEKESKTAPFYEDMNEKIRTVKGQLATLTSAIAKVKKAEEELAKRFFIVKAIDHEAGIPYGWKQATYSEVEPYLHLLTPDLAEHQYTLLADACLTSSGAVAEDLPRVYFPTAHIIVPVKPED
eukprot:TRINITY_DN149_c6_g1_i1.p1 TRINITY_DN149_c6_g1~~TRINITY_DN149_c6_g1_i1.p1  ORF type:complete len:218 (+),score=41.89 TRINITY_DN149_c6_g1_i1:58-654(+)